MQPASRRACFVITTAVLGLTVLPALTARAADQTILGARLTVTDKKPGDPSGRRMVFSAREANSANTLSGDPTVAGSSGGGLLHILLASSNVVIPMPQGTSRSGRPFWQARNGGFQYADPRGENGPVASLVLRKAKNGTFSIRGTLSAKYRALTVVPPGFGQGGTEAFVMLSLSGGDRYCVSYLPPAKISHQPDRSYNVSRVTGEACPFTVFGQFDALAYNVAGLPEGISGSHPATNTPIISPLLNAYDLVLNQETWQTPDPNPLAPLRVYHELLVADAHQPYKSIPATQPLGSNPLRPSALLGDGLNQMSVFPFTPVIRVPWNGCHNSASDCLALKGFSISRMTFAPGIEVDVYDLHMEAGGDPEDEVLRDAGVTQLVGAMNGYSAGHAIIIGGDFNLHTDEEPDRTTYRRLLDEAGLRDACTNVSCPDVGRIDKFAYRDGDGIVLTALSWRLETDVFVDPQGGPLSDHDALKVRFMWSKTSPP